MKRCFDGTERSRNGAICFSLQMIQLAVVATTTLCLWRLTGLRGKVVEKLGRVSQKVTKEKEKVATMMVAANLEKGNQCRTRAKIVEKETRLKSGHYARECWQNQNVRNVQNVSNGGQGQQDHGQSTGQQSGQQPQTQQPPVNQSTQYRVSRISELNEHEEHVGADQGQFVFDLRDSPQTSPKSNCSVRALRFYIGDEDDAFCNQPSDVRAIVTELQEDEHLEQFCWTVVQTLLSFHLHMQGQVKRFLESVQSCVMLRGAAFQ